ncbi:MAG TPA: hypothetical protein VFV79_08725 [Saprospiraceae bacterium]|nr:hypothetical protein [Saprospiraceae bacterium]
MNQKNIFSVISIVLILQGIAFFAMGDKMITDTFPTVDANGHLALMKLLEVMAALSILTGIITWANRTSANVAWAYTLGSLVLLGVTMKHMLMDHINVPTFAWVIQALITLSCAYLWLGKKETRTAMA